MNQAWRQAIMRRPQPLWTGVEGWLRQSVSDGRDPKFRSDIVFCACPVIMKSTDFFLFQEKITATAKHAYIHC
jgi:hypothetical protein